MSRQGDPSKEEETKGWKPHQTEVQTFDPRGILQISGMREKKRRYKELFVRSSFICFKWDRENGKIIVPFSHKIKMSFKKKVIKCIALSKIRTYSHVGKQILVFENIYKYKKPK